MPQHSTHRPFGRTQLMVHHTAPGELDGSITPPGFTPARDDAERTAHTYLNPPRVGPKPASHPVWGRAIRRRHLRQMQGALEWAFLGWIVGMLTARAWGLA
jgi:hypothetical protein